MTEIVNWCETCGQLPFFPSAHRVTPSSLARAPRLNYLPPFFCVSGVNTVVGAIWCYKYRSHGELKRAPVVPRRKS